MDDSSKSTSNQIEEPPIQRAREGTWARPVESLNSSNVQADININVDGKQLAGPLRGFGQMWQKTYAIRMAGVNVPPQQVIKAWKENFGSFWPKKNRFFAAGTEIAAGDVAVLNLAGPYGLMAPGGKGMVSTGVLVIYSDDESFSFMTPEGHIFAGMITFSAFVEGDSTVAQIQALIRANDPLYEIGARIGIVHQMEDEHWHAVLQNLARHFGVEGTATQVNTLIDPGVRWSQAKNVWHNAAIHTGIYLALSPLRWAGGIFRKRK